MCGIVGLFYKDPEHFVSEDTVRSMCDTIRHRGPDDCGRWLGGLSAGTGWALWPGVGHGGATPLPRSNARPEAKWCIP